MTRRLAVFTAVALLALTGCSKKEPSTASTADTVVSATAGPTATPEATKSTRPTPLTSTPTPTGPIVYYRIKTKPSCPSSGPGASFPGNGVELEWKVTGATNVTISIDGPGIFGTYTAEHKETFPFGCEGTSGTIQKHTFLLKVVGTSVQQTITAEARVN